MTGPAVVARASLAVGLCAGLALACGSGGPSESELLAALQEEAGELRCSDGPLRLHTVLLQEGGPFLQAPVGDAELTAALQAGGLIGPAQTLVTGGGILRRRIEAHPVTQAAREHVHASSGLVQKSQGSLDEVCYGRRVITQVTELSEPSTTMGQTVVRAEFEHSLEPLSWVTDSRILEIFDPQGAGPRTGRALFLETDSGWRLESLDWEADSRANAGG